ncbi:29 kDa ribonucleoprotein A, chloroplastic-like [Senna tora]|uniref:29 kDa ribonucleoprotein A, chloroplastic-like n=1 Tax=Senna tora TaxID=362788 RepID=A0A834SKX5_9FABA|nr:29 kDa ribonucleoprotein A, chloroplastic-like [Senna tora]
MSSSAASLALPTLTSTSQTLCSARQAFFSPHSISSVSLRLKSNPISITASFLQFHTPSLSFSSRFLPNVALSSQFDQDEILSEGDEPSYSPDLKLFVGNLPFSVDSAQLAQLFEGAGNVEMVEVIYDKMTGRSRGFGFVTMSNTDEVEAAARLFNGYELDGRQLRVNFGPPPPKRENAPFRTPRGGSGSASDSGYRVHVGNLAWGVDNLALETLFGEQGKVLEAKVIYDRESGRSRGFGFVTYSSAEEVNSAIESLDGVDLNGRSIRVSLADAKPPRRQF